MPSCTNVECPVPVRWSENYGDGVWVHSTTRERKCPVGGLTPPFSQRRQRPAERSWHCPECGTWNVASQDGHGALTAVCTGPLHVPHPETVWQQIESLGAEDLPELAEVRLSPDRRLVAIRTGDKKWARWRVSDGSRRTDDRVADWAVLPVPGQQVGTQPEAAPEAVQAAEPELIEYGIQYLYNAPDRWHALPNVTFSEPEEAVRAVRQRQRGSGSKYRMVRRRAAGPWEPVTEQDGAVTVGAHSPAV